MGCAECHDHKFDPFTQKDFYSFAAFFADIQQPAVGNPPTFPVMSEDHQQQLGEFDRTLAGLRRTADTPTAELAAAQQRWEVDVLAQLASTPEFSPWHAIGPFRAASFDAAHAEQYVDPAAVDLAAAIGWWSRAAALGDATAAYNAGLLLLRSAEGDERARALLAQAAAHGDARAAFALGTELATHDDRHAAIPLLEQAAKSGYAPAQYNLARLHEAHDRAAAVHWYRRAAPDFAPAAEALARLEAETSGPTSGPGGAETPTDGRAWLLAQPPSAYTIQVGAGPDPQALARLLDAHAGTLPSAWFAHRREGGDPYVAVVGSFADPAAAEAALATLPEALTRHRPWVRRIGGLQSTLDAAAPP